MRSIEHPRSGRTVKNDASSFGRDDGFARGPSLSGLSLPIIGLGVIVVVAVLMIAIVAVHNGRTEALRGSEAATANLVRALADGTARSMETVEAAVTFVAEVLEDQSDLHISRALRRQVGDRLAQTPTLRQIIIARDDGLVLLDTAGHLEGNALDLAPYRGGSEITRRISRLGNVEERRFIGGGRAAGRTLFPVSRQISDLDGKSRGMIIAAVNPSHFLSIGATLDLGEAPWVALYRFDGAPLSGGDGKALDADTVTALRHREEAGTRRMVMSDGVERIVSFRATAVWPLVVEIGVTTESALAAWRASLPRLIILVVIIGLAVFVSTAALVRASQRRTNDEAALRLSDEVLRNIRGGVVIADLDLPDQPVIYTNDALERIAGVTLASLNERASVRLPAMRALAAEAPADGDEASDGGAQLIRWLIGHDETKQARRHSFRREGEGGGEGEVVWVDIMVSRVADLRAKRTHAVIVMHDVTEQVHAERELLRGFDELAALHDEQERFSEILAHHLQEPVRKIVVHGQMLRRALPAEGLTEAASEALSVLDSSGRRLRHLLRDVELFISAGGRASVSGTASVADALNWVTTKLRFALEESGAQILSNPLPMVAMGVSPLREVLYALIDNAIKYRSPDRTLVISFDANQDGDKWVVCVEDNGIGIDPAYCERIFRVFERLSTGDAHEGTGIGLALVRKFVERSGGRVWVESEPGKGSRFLMSLPAAVRAIPSSEAAAKV